MNPEPKPDFSGNFLVLDESEVCLEPIPKELTCEVNYSDLLPVSVKEILETKKRIREDSAYWWSDYEEIPHNPIPGLIEIPYPEEKEIPELNLIPESEPELRINTKSFDQTYKQFMEQFRADLKSKKHFDGWDAVG